MYRRCQQSVMAVFIEVLVLYMEGNDHGNMYTGKGMPPNCSSTHPPLPTNCTLCTRGEHVFTVCGNMTENSKLVMEGDGRTIDLMDSECPGMLATIKNPDILDKDAGERTHWTLIPILVLLVLFVLFVLFVVARMKYGNKFRQRLRNKLGLRDTCSI